MKGDNLEMPTAPKYMIFLSYAYLFTYYTRIQDNIPGLSAVPWVGALFLIVTLLGAFKIFSSEEKFFSQPVGLIFWLGVLFAITGIDAVSTASYKLSIKWILQTFPQCVALVVVFSSMSMLKKLHSFWCVIYLFMAVFTLKNAPRGPGDFTNDPNDACLALGMGIPFVFYSLQQANLTRNNRFFLYISLFLIFAAIVATNSRGGFLGMITGLLAIWWMSKNRVKTMLYAMVGLLLTGGMLLSVVPQSYVKDIESINDTEDDTRIERFRTWEIAWVMFKDNPVLGIGAGNFSNTVRLYQHKTSWWTGAQKSLNGRVTHSLHFQVLSELGLLGVLIYGYVMFFVPLKLLKIYKKFDTNDHEQLQLKLFCQSLIASMGVFVIAGAFISVAYYPHVPIWLAMYTIFIIVTKKKHGEVLSK
tara:strand:+ start:16655 stop:17902 length:1248 start_codon:yes stop_codon:yes gene_type:complete